MDWIDSHIDRLTEQRAWGYRDSQPPAAEPLALAALALALHNRQDPARRALELLRSWQTDRGSVGVTADQLDPIWPTALAILAWRQGPAPVADADPFREPLELGCRALLDVRGKPLPRSQEMGHDTTLVGWPWVAETHSWLEPTCFAVLALRAAGQAAHPRVIEAKRLLHNRLLPSGGANYGNTLVFGQELLPHIQPTGLVLAALAGERDTDGRMGRALGWLERACQPRTTAASLGYALLGLAAHGRWPADASTLMADAVERGHRPNAFLLGQTLLVLAALGEQNPFIALANDS